MTELSVFDSEYMMPAYVGAMSMNEEQWPDAGSKENEGESNMFNILHEHSPLLHAFCFLRWYQI